jgi:hypothetical protein
MLLDARDVRDPLFQSPHQFAFGVEIWLLKKGSGVHVSLQALSMATIHNDALCVQFTTMHCLQFITKSKHNATGARSQRSAAISIIKVKGTCHGARAL